MCLWRRMNETKWTGKIKNEEVLKKIIEDRSILKNIKRKEGNCISYILIRDCLQSLIIEVKLFRERSSGRRGFGTNNRFNGREKVRPHEKKKRSIQKCR